MKKLKFTLACVICILISAAITIPITYYNTDLANMLGFFLGIIMSFPLFNYWEKLFES